MLRSGLRRSISLLRSLLTCRWPYEEEIEDEAEEVVIDGEVIVLDP
jgi:hypothetical protein